MIERELNDALRARFNPEGSPLRRQQRRMLDILLYVDDICRRHNIRYWLSSGTLLGAVRHGGFIPWDDDLDIEMLREDYIRLLEHFEPSDDFVLQTRHNERYYLQPFAKVRDRHTILDECGNNLNYRHQGLFIDIFALEESPRPAYVGYGVLLHLLTRLQRGRTGGLAHHIVTLGKSLVYGSIALLRPAMNLLPFKSLNHTYGAAPRWQSRNIEDIMPLRTIEFEGHTLPAPHDVDAYLRRMYGNYEALPDLRQLRTHSNGCRFLD